MNLSMKQNQSYLWLPSIKETYGYQGVRQGEINWETETDIE